MRTFVVVGCLLMMTGCAGKPDYVKQVEKSRQVPVVITDYGTTWPDQAGAVGFHVALFNTSARAIDSIELDVETYNLAGEPMIDEWSGQSLLSLRLDGPLAAGQSNVHPLSHTPTRWQDVWHNHQIACGKIQAVRVTFMDGEVQQFPETSALIQNNECRGAY